MVTKTFSVMATCVLKSEPEITHLPGFDVLKSSWQQVHQLTLWRLKQNNNNLHPSRYSQDSEEISPLLEKLTVSIILGRVVDHGARKREPSNGESSKITYLIKGHQAILNILSVWLTLFLINPHQLSCNHRWQLAREGCHMTLDIRTPPAKSMLQFLTLGSCT